MAATAELWKALRWGAPIVVILYEDAELREQLISEMELLAPEGRRIRRIRDVEEAFQDLDSILFLTPGDERKALRVLDGKREAMVERTTPLVVFLVRDGDGARGLDSAPGLASWVQGKVIDPHRLEQIDLKSERERFHQETKLWPEEWLAQYRSGILPDTLENALMSCHAGLLEEPA